MYSGYQESFESFHHQTGQTIWLDRVARAGNFRIKRLDLLNVDYQNNNQELKINSNHALILFRIVQECINNVIKHSQSKDLQLLVIDSPENLNIEINDNGVGFNSDLENDGSGIKNMGSRAKLINAELLINSLENIGTKVCVSYKNNSYG